MARGRGGLSSPDDPIRLERARHFRLEDVKLLLGDIPERTLGHAKVLAKNFLRNVAQEVGRRSAPGAGDDPSGTGTPAASGAFRSRNPEASPYREFGQLLEEKMAQDEEFRNALYAECGIRRRDLFQPGQDFHQQEELAVALARRTDNGWKQQGNQSTQAFAIE